MSGSINVCDDLWHHVLMFCNPPNTGSDKRGIWVDDVEDASVTYSTYSGTGNIRHNYRYGSIGNRFDGNFAAGTDFAIAELALGLNDPGNTDFSIEANRRLFIKSNLQPQRDRTLWPAGTYAIFGGGSEISTVAEWVADQGQEPEAGPPVLMHEVDDGGPTPTALDLIAGPRVAGEA